MKRRDIALLELLSLLDSWNNDDAVSIFGIGDERHGDLVVLGRLNDYKGRRIKPHSSNWKVLDVHDGLVRGGRGDGEEEMRKARRFSLVQLREQSQWPRRTRVGWLAVGREIASLVTARLFL